MGVQRCIADGTFGACVCAMVGADAGTAPDVVPRADAGSIPDVVSGLDAGGPADVLNVAADAPSFDVVPTDVQMAADVVGVRVDAGAPSPDVVDAGPPCLAPRALCGGACVDPRSDPQNCGACAVACAAGQVCAESTCRVACPTGQVACGGRCATLSTDNQHCGRCDTVCGATEACAGGACRSACASDQIACGGRCVSPQTDNQHCGRCGAACAPGQACIAGACTTTCTVGLTACGALCVDLRADDANCGGCGRPCAAGQRCTGGACGTVERWSANWTYPALVQPPSGDGLFPTYQAHLLGTNRGTTPFPHLACATVRNPTRTRVAVTLQTNLAGYTVAPAEQTVDVDAGATVTRCLTPTFSGSAFRAITASAAASVQATARDAVGTAVTDSRRVIVLPLNNVIWNPLGGPIDPGWAALSAVAVQPSDASVRTGLVPSAIGYSRTGSLQVGYMSTGTPYARTHILSPTLPYSFESLVVDGGETYDLRFAISAIDGGAVGLNAYLFTQAQFFEWRDRGGREAVQTWIGLTPAVEYVRAGLVAGGYFLVLHAPTLAAGFRTVRWTRTNTRTDHARDALESIFTALNRRGVVYQDLGSNYYESAFGQRIRLPAETYAVSLANCIDGTALFASALEAGGFQPVLIYVQGPSYGHAYVGVRVGRGSPTVLPVETTMVGGGDFSAAHIRGLENYSNHLADPRYTVTAVDVSTVRGLGVAPIPW